MDLIYPLRWQELLEKGMEITVILKVYPPLKKIDQVYSSKQKHTETGIIILLQIYSEFNQIFDEEMITIIKDIDGRIQDPKYWKQQKINRTVP